MVLAIGNKVAYPSQGPCRIGRIVKRVVDGTPIRFYHLVMLGGSGELFVPVDKAQDIGVRLLLDRSEIPVLFGQLQTAASAPGSSRQQLLDNSKRFSSGSPFDLAIIVESLTSQTLDKARRLLIREISEVLGESGEEAEGQLDRALEVRKEEQAPI